MNTITASKARSKLYTLLDEIAESREFIQITGKRHNGILISEQDWRSIEETLFLNAIPKMSQSIKKGMKTPLKACSQELKW